MATLYLMVGYPGAGKTTISQYISELTGAEHIWVDHERHKLFSSPTHSEHENRELYNRLNIDTDHLLRDGISVIFDTSFNHYRDREYLRSIATKNNANTVVIWLTTSKELSKSRAMDAAHANHNRYMEPMSPDEFERIAHNLEPPRPEEQPIQIDGSGHVTQEQVKQLLGL